MNNIIVTGRLTQDINAPLNGRPLYGKVNGTDRSFYGNSIAVDDGYYGKDGQWVERSYFFNLRAYNNVADNLATNYFKGDSVLIQGKLVAEKYTTQDGKTGINTYIEVNKVERSSRANPHKQNAPVAGQPVASQPVQTQPAAPYNAQPVAGQPVQNPVAQPVAGQPTVPQNTIEDFASLDEGLPFV